MKKAALLFVFLFPICTFPQNEDAWIAFEDEKTTLIGFKDINGAVKIEPRYTGYMAARKLSYIAAVTDDNNESYYILRNGFHVGKDSLYIFDNGFDCESEGFIRFRDPKNEKIGMFNREGEVVIPAAYDALTNIINGLAAGLKDAKKEYLDEDKEHWTWNGGTEYLIDNENNILVKDFRYNYQLDFHSLKIEDSPSQDTCRDSFLGANNKYYTFSNNERLFKEWLINSFTKNFNKESAAENSYFQIVFWDDVKGWLSKNSSDFINDNYEIIKQRISGLSDEDADYFISVEDYIICPVEMEKEFEQYLNNCGNLKFTQYPSIDLIINHKNENGLYQDHFGFLKTEEGFKLLNVSFGKK